MRAKKGMTRRTKGSRPGREGKDTRHSRARRIGEGVLILFATSAHTHRENFPSCITSVEHRRDKDAKFDTLPLSPPGPLCLLATQGFHGKPGPVRTKTEGGGPSKRAADEKLHYSYSLAKHGFIPSDRSHAIRQSCEHMLFVDAAAGILLPGLPGLPSIRQDRTGQAEWTK